MPSSWLIGNSTYLLHLVQEKHVSWSVFNQTVAALRFLYEVTLDRRGHGTHPLSQAAQTSPHRSQPVFLSLTGLLSPMLIQSRLTRLILTDHPRRINTA